MLKLKEFLLDNGKLCAAAPLIFLLAGCGSGGGSDNILCGGDPCSAESGTGDGFFEESISVADADGFSFAADRFNPESYNINNVGVDITININDFEGNPPPNGTVVLLDTEAGTIPTQCVVADGSCSVTWVSSDPRPGFGTNPLGAIDGRFIIFARALGAESFTDLDNDDRFDGVGAEPFTDLPEPFFDINENGRWDAGEEFEDSPGGVAGVYDAADGLYNGPRCNADCSPNPSIYVGGTTSLGSYTFVMSTSDAYVWRDTDEEIQRDYVPSAARDTPLPIPDAITNEGAGIDISAGSIRFNNVFVGDRFGNSMSSGTTIEITAQNATVTGKTSVTVVDTAISAAEMSFTLATDGTPGADAELIMTITSGEASVETIYTWPVTD